MDLIYPGEGLCLDALIIIILLLLLIIIITLYILARACVWIPIPSPMKMITFLARLSNLSMANIRRISEAPCRLQNTASDSQ